MESDIPRQILEAHPRACPREGCGSYNVKFRYFNSKKGAGFTQPRYTCKVCGNMFTRGGRLYKVSKPGAAAKETAPATKGQGRRGAKERRVGIAGQPARYGPADPAAPPDWGSARAAVLPAKPGVLKKARAMRRLWEADAEGGPDFPMDLDVGVGPGEADAKELVRRRINDRVLAGRVAMSKVGLELKSLGIELRSRGVLDKVSGEVSPERAQELVTAATMSGAQDGRVYECSLERYTRLRAGREDMQEVAGEMIAVKRSLDNMDVEHASLADLLETERRVRGLAKRMHELV